MEGKEGDKAKRKELKQELNKLKKLVKEKDREIMKLKQEAIISKRQIVIDNNSFTNKD